MLTHNKELKRARTLLAGDDSDCREFFNEFFPRLYRYTILRMSGDHQSTREVVHSSLAKILLNIDKFRGDSSLFTWMCSICNNEISSFLKNENRYKQSVVLNSELCEKDISEVAIETDHGAQPEDLYGRDQKTLAIHQALDALPANYGNILEWKYIEELSVREIARRMGLSHIATQSVLYRARMAFQEVFPKLAPSLN